MSKTADSLLTAFSPSHKIRVVFAEVTDSARELERSHLCGPTAGLIQAEALAGVALLSHELNLPDETVTMQMRVSGPVGGVLVEAGADGGLRGYTHVKVLNQLDDYEELDLSIAMGEFAEVEIIRSIPGKILADSIMKVTPASFTKGVEEYYVNSLQRRVTVQLCALAYGGFIDGARGMLAECLPDGDAVAYNRINRFFMDGSISEALESSASHQSICDSLGLTDLVFESPRALKFACRCTSERVESMMATLPLEDLRELVAKGTAARIFCHMCGKSYEFSLARLQALLSGRS